MKKPIIVYKYRGQVERLTSGGRGDWREGYSPDDEHGPVYPWATKREAQKEARAKGCRAVFMYGK